LKAESESNIPTLTDIAHPGKHDMLNHFDGHQFEDETETSFSFENASELENTGDLENAPVIEDTEFNEIPSITINDENTNDVPSEDFTDALQSVVNSPKSNSKNNSATNAATSTANKKFEDKKLKEKIDQAISEALPGIEAQLKGKLYTKFGI